MTESKYENWNISEIQAETERLNNNSLHVLVNAKKLLFIAGVLSIVSLMLSLVKWTH